MASSGLERTARRITMRTLRFAKAEEGVVMTEFIIIAPLFVFLITGTIQFMGISHGDALLQYANFMACRTGIVHYESIQRNWDSSRSSGNRNMRVIEVMEDGAEHALGPIFRPMAGYIDMAENPTRAISNSPIAIKEVRVTPGTINLPMPQYQYLPVWLTSETEVDMGLAWPWVGRAIQAMHVGAPTTDEEGYKAKGFDPMSTTGEPPQMAQMYYDDMPYIVVKSDAFLDTRQSDDEARTFVFPFNLTGGTYSRVNHGSYNVQNKTLGSTDPQPLALPIQSRLR